MGIVRFCSAVAYIPILIKYGYISIKVFHIKILALNAQMAGLKELLS
ncbi:hypothetical protein [Methanosarcina siciliae]|nr:hypothetical protein [Methanosarcina siciliae]